MGGGSKGESSTTPQVPEIQQKLMEAALRGHGSKARLSEVYNEFHALIVELGKQFCRTKPLCGNCPLRKDCVTGQLNGTSS